MKRAATLLFALSAAACASEPDYVEVPLPSGEIGIGFDDLAYSTSLQAVLAPAGRTGELCLVDPVSLDVSVVAGFAFDGTFAGGHSQGATSVTEGDGFLFVTDRTRADVAVIDPIERAIVARVALAATPDYVRFVASTHEIWVTEPSREQIEVLRLANSKPPVPKAITTIAIPGGPESLVIDRDRSRAYTNAGRKTVGVDLASRVVRSEADNGCESARGIDLDPATGLVFVGCGDGGVSVLGAGSVLASGRVGGGVDVIAFSRFLRHLYVPSADDGTLSVFSVGGDAASPSFALRGTLDAAVGAHCVTADDRGGIWVCDPDLGELLLFEDGLAP